MSSKRKELFRKHGIEIPQPGDTRWYYRSRTVGVIFEKHQSLLTALECILENPQTWDDITLSMSSGLLQHLNSFVFCFLMTLFNKIFQQSSILFMVLQNRQTGLSFGISKIICFLDFLHNLRSDNSFTEFFASVVEIIGEPKTRLDLKYNYKRLFYEVIDNIVSMLEERFLDLKDFAFLDLVNPHCFFNWQNNVPVEKLELLRMKYGPLIKISLLEQQLLYIYRDTDFYKASSQELLDYII